MRSRLPLDMRRHSNRTGALVVLIAFGMLAAACGGNAAPPDAGGTGSPTTTSLPSTPASTGRPKPPTSDPTTRPSITANPSAGSTAPGTSFVLDLKCARRGVDVQGITIQTRPGGPAGFNTYYSDGSSNVDGKSNYTSGFGGGFAEPNGQWRMTWTVPGNAPTGVATVYASTQEHPKLELKFTVADQNGSCPS